MGKFHIFVAKIQTPEKSHDNKAKIDGYTLRDKLVTLRN